MKTMTKLSAVSAIAISALVFGGTTAASASTVTSSAIAVETRADASAETGQQRAEALTQLLSDIESIPDSVLKQGDEATQEWIEANLTESGFQAQASILGCTGAIAAALAGVAFPAAKLLKVKKLMNELGGVAEAVKIMWGASFSYEKMQAAGGALAALAAELVGITGIKNECFS